VVAITILVLAIFMIPLTVWATRSGRRRGRPKGIDWNRGAPDVSTQVLEGARLLAADDARGTLSAMNRALGLDPKNADALALRASAHHRLGDLDAALADYDQAIALSPRSETYNDRGCLHQQRGDLDRALADLEEALRRSPDNATAHASLAEVLAERKDLDGALEAIKKAVALDPTWRDHARTAALLAPVREAHPDDPLFSA
jgi:tetratricopeptide (TPR) repeat protein